MKFKLILSFVLFLTQITTFAQSQDEYFYIKNNKTGLYLESCYKFVKTGLFNKDGSEKYNIISQFGGYLQTDSIYPFELMISDRNNLENQYFILKESSNGSYYILSSSRNMYLTIISETEYHIYPRIAQPKPDYQLWVLEREAPSQIQDHYYTFSKVESQSHLEGMRAQRETTVIIAEPQMNDHIIEEKPQIEQSQVEVKPIKTKTNANYSSYASYIYASKPTAQSSMNMIGFARHVFKPTLGYYYSATTSTPFLSYNRTQDQMNIRYRHASQLTGGITYRLNDYMIATAGIGLGTNKESLSDANKEVRKTDIYLSPEIGIALDLKYVTLFANYRLPFPISTTTYRYNYFTSFSFGAGITPNLLTIFKPSKHNADRITFEFGQKVYNVRNSNVLMTNLEGSYSFLGDEIKLKAGMNFAYSPISMDWTFLRLGGEYFVSDILALEVYYNAIDLIYQNNKGSILCGGIGFKTSVMFHFISLSPYIEYYFPYGNYAGYSALVYLREKFTGWNIGLNLGISLGF